MIGIRLKEERERLGLSQTALADSAGVGKTTVINWEKSSSSPTAEQLALMAKINFDVAYIITGANLLTYQFQTQHQESRFFASDIDRSHQLSENESKLLKAYRRLDSHVKKSIVALVESLINKDG